MLPPLAVRQPPLVAALPVPLDERLCPYSTDRIHLVEVEVGQVAESYYKSRLYQRFWYSRLWFVTEPFQKESKPKQLLESRSASSLSFPLWRARIQRPAFFNVPAIACCLYYGPWKWC